MVQATPTDLEKNFLDEEGLNYFWGKIDNAKQDTLATQTAYSAKGSATKVPKITTNSLGQVTGITEVNITYPTVDSSLSSASTNAIQNRAVNTAILNVSSSIAQKVDKTVLNYSSTEVAVGTWVDGQTIYRKTIDTTKANLATTMNAIGINILVNMHLMAESKYSATLPIPTYFTEAGYQTMFHQNKTTRAFTFNFGNYYEDTSKVYGWVEYTKSGS